MHVRKRRLMGAGLGLAMALTLFLSGCGGRAGVTIGSKNFTESILVSEILAQLIENRTELEVKRNQNMAGTFVCFEAIRNGEIDIYPEYTGTALTALLEMPVITDKDEAYDAVQKEFNERFGITWMKPFGLNNTYAVILTSELAERYALKTTTDLITVADQLVFAANHEFFNRDDGYDGFVDHYGITFKGDPVKMDITLLYQAVSGGDVDVIIDAATSGPIRQYGLVILEDDQHFFPPYHLAPIIRDETLEEHPELEEILNLLAGEVDDTTMTDLNYQVDVEKREVKDVAADFLRERGLVE